MKGREIRRRYQDKSKRYFRRILGLYHIFKKKYSFFKKKHFQNIKRNKKLTKEELDKDLENHLNNNQEKKEKDADVEMADKKN